MRHCSITSPISSHYGQFILVIRCHKQEVCILFVWNRSRFHMIIGHNLLGIELIMPHYKCLRLPVRKSALLTVFQIISHIRSQVCGGNTSYVIGMKLHMWYLHKVSIARHICYAQWNILWGVICPWTLCESYIPGFN